VLPEVRLWGPYHQRQRRPCGPHQQWRRGPQAHRGPQSPRQRGPRCGGPRRRVGCASLVVVDNAKPTPRATAQHEASRI